MHLGKHAATFKTRNAGRNGPRRKMPLSLAILNPQSTPPSLIEQNHSGAIMQATKLPK
jgi:hypothetical protein